MKGFLLLHIFLNEKCFSLYKEQFSSKYIHLIISKGYLSTFDDLESIAEIHSNERC